MYDPREIRDKCAIAGIGLTDLSKDSGRSELMLACQAIDLALKDAGVSRNEVDGLLKWDMDNSYEWDIAKNCGFKNVKFFGQVGPGGGGACGTITHAVAAITAGMANCVVIWRALNGRSGVRYGKIAGDQRASFGAGSSILWADQGLQYKAPFGILSPPQQAAIRTRRYMHRYNATVNQFGAVAVACRKHAQTNPNAIMYGKPITLDDHANSRMIADPIRLLDCTLECDGGGAIVIVSAERARDLKQKPAYIMAVAQGMENSGEVMSDYPREMTAFPDCELVAQQLYHMAGVTPKDIDVAQLYDAFTLVVIGQLEAYGFCKPGEGAAFAENGNIELGGALPVNTSGGNLSEGYTHGMTHIIEGVRQVRGTSLAQVPNAELCLVTAGPVVPTSGMILRR